MIINAASTIKITKYINIVTEYVITNLFFLRIKPYIPPKLDNIIMTDVIMNVAIKPLRKSGKICAVTDDIKNAYTSTYKSRMPNNRVTTVPAEIRVFRQYTDKNIKIIFNLFLLLPYNICTLLLYAII